MKNIFICTLIAVGAYAAKLREDGPPDFEQPILDMPNPMPDGPVPYGPELPPEFGDDSCKPFEETDCVFEAVMAGIPDVESCNMGTAYECGDFTPMPISCDVTVVADGLTIGGECERVMQLAVSVWGIEMPHDELEEIVGDDPSSYSPYQDITLEEDPFAGEYDGGDRSPLPVDPFEGEIDV